MPEFKKAKKVIIYRNTDDKKVIVDSIKEASEVTGCPIGYIRRSAKTSNHYSNNAEDWSPMTQDGDLKKNQTKPLYRFEYIEPLVVTATAMFDCEIKTYRFTSSYGAIKTIGCNHSTFFDHKKKKINYIVDKQKRLWMLEWPEGDN